MLMLHVVRAGAPEGRAQTDNDHAHREGGQQAHQFGAADHPVHRNPVDTEPEQKAADADHRHRQVGIDAEPADQEIEAEHAQRDHGPVGQVDDLHDAEDQGQADGGQPVDRPQQKAVENRDKDTSHSGASSLGGRGEAPAREWLRVDQDGPWPRRGAATGRHYCCLIGNISGAVPAAFGHTTSLTSLPFFFCHWARTMSWPICRP